MSTRDLVKKLWPIVGILIIGIIGWIAVFHPPYGKLVCEYESAPGDPHAEYTYTTKFKLWKVHEIETKQIITSYKAEILQRFKEEAEAASLEYQDIKDYQINISLKEKKLTSTTIINYNSMTSAEYASLMKSENVRKKSLYIHSVKKMYQKIGAKCEYK